MGDEGRGGKLIISFLHETAQGIKVKDRKRTDVLLRSAASVKAK